MSLIVLVHEILSSIRLKEEFDRQLPDSWISGGVDETEGRINDVALRRVELSMIENVVELGAKFQLLRFRDFHVLH